MVDRAPLPEWSDLLKQKDAELTALRADVELLRAALGQIAQYEIE